MELAASLRTAARAILAVTTLTLVVSCSHGTSGARITVGAGNSPQSELIAQIYAGALARTGAQTRVAVHLGGRGDYLAALDADRVTLVGDDSGDLLTTLDATSTARVPDPDAVEALASESTGTTTSQPAPGSSVSDALSRALPEGLVVSDIADGTDLRPDFVLSAATAARVPHALPDLAARCGELTVGIATGSELDPLRRSPDPQRDVLTPLRQVYGCDITHSTVYPNDTAVRNALRDGRIQAGVLTAPATLLPGGPGDLVAVADPRYAFRAQNVIPLFRQGSLTGTQIKKLNYVAGELTTDELTTLIRRLRDDHASAADLARGWLDEHDL